MARYVIYVCLLPSLYYEEENKAFESLFGGLEKLIGTKSLPQCLECCNYHVNSDVSTSILKTGLWRY